MTQPADNAPDIEEVPSAGQAPPAQDIGPETEAEAREREIQRRLTQQGREAAEARRQAALAQQALTAQTAKLTELEAATRLLSANLSERDKRDAEQRQAQIKAELERLPPADRLQRQIEMLQGQIDTMRTAAPSAQPAPQTSPQAQPSQSTQREYTDEERRQYMESRVKQIVDEAERAYGVRPNLDSIPDTDRESEDAFVRAVMTQARGQGGTPVAQKAETPEQMRERIRQEERDKLGVNAPNAARAAAPASRRTKAASEEDVRGAAQSYNSKLGPKANIERLQKLRESMG
jgi:hypothetical protein